MFKYSINNVDRTWTREQWKRMSRWCRLVQRHMDKLNVNSVLYSMMVAGQGQAGGRINTDWRTNG